MKSITEMFPNASADTVAANPQLLATNGGSGKQNDSTGILSAPQAKRGRMNKTESEFALILEGQKRRGEILRAEFEGITLRFASVKYTPDFVVFVGADSLVGIPKIRLIEVKGPFIKGNRERAVERFRHAKTYWPEFTFEMHQKTKEGWKQII